MVHSKTRRKIPVAPEKRFSRFPIIFFTCIILFLLIVVNIYNTSSNFFESQPTLSTLLQNKTVTIVLAGYGGGNHDGAYLTDTLMVLSINPTDKSISVLSLPRDLWVTLPVGITAKINTAYEIGRNDEAFPTKPDEYKGQLGGGKLLKETISSVTGLPIDYWIGVDFSGFSKFVDAIGGVDVDVETTFDDPEYPIEGRETDTCGAQETDLPRLFSLAVTDPVSAFPCRYEQLHFDKGLRHMDGATALKYVRSRHGIRDGSDFGRGTRQRRFLLAVKNKLLSPLVVPKLIPILASIKSFITTDIEPKALLTLSTVGIEFSSYQTRMIDLLAGDVLRDGTSPDGQSIIVPTAGIGNWSAMQTYISAELGRKIPILKLINASGSPQRAATAVQRLKADGFIVLDTIDMRDATSENSVISVPNSTISPSFLRKLEMEFDTQTSIENATGEGQSIITITIGKTYGE